MAVQGFAVLLMKFLVKYTAQKAFERAAVQAPYSSSMVGLASLSPLDVQSQMLTVILRVVAHNKDQLYLERHVLPLCIPPLVQLAEANMRCYEGLTNFTAMPVLEPYFTLLGMFCCEAWPCPPQLKALAAVALYVSHAVGCVSWHCNHCAMHLSHAH